MMADWTGIFVVVGVAILVFLLKYLIIRCYITACRRNESISEETRGADSVGNSMIIDFLETRNQGRLAAMRGRKPPPKFENAFKCSTPVSFIQVDDGPPPTYDEYLVMRRASEQRSAAEDELTSVIVMPRVHSPPVPSRDTSDDQSGSCSITTATPALPPT